MEANENKVWFPAKKYGWGWGFPCSWQGRTFILVWVASLFAGGAVLAPTHIDLFIAYAVLMGLIYIAVALIKGEKPRWRWGDEPKAQPRSSAERLAELEDLHRRRLISPSEYEAKRQDILRDV